MKKIALLIIAIIFVQNCTDNNKNFTSEQTALIMAADSSTVMRVWTIADKQDSLLLRSKSADVIIKKDDEILQNLIDRMYTTVNDSATQGVGIAAPQVGILKNVIWVQRFDKENKPFEVYLNPVIKQYSELKQDCREGCLSVPVIKDTTHSRSYAILLEHDKPDGNHCTEMVEGFTAVIFQHEIDHLNGIIFLDRLEDEFKD